MMSGWCGAQTTVLGSFRRWLGRALISGALLSTSTLITLAHATSAADKAVARELATSGIEKLEAGDAAGGLEDLKKAQALYDAPVHLLYIARAHEHLGQLVEAAEAYRSLARVRLKADAPSAFVQAQESGAEELQALEPRIARLTIEVNPSDAAELQVTLNGQELNAASLGVARPTNPGEIEVLVEAPGYHPAKANVSLEEGGEDSVAITLEPSGDEIPEAVAEKKGEKDGDSDWRKSGPMGFIAGVRLGGGVPLGEVENGVPMSNYYGPTAVGRIDLGFRFLHFVMAKIYASGGTMIPGSAFDDYSDALDGALAATSSAATADIGVALGLTTNPRKLGGFGEIGYSFLHGYRWQQDVAPDGGGQDICSDSVAHTGWAARIGGGMNIPLHRIFTLVPAVDFSVGQIGKRTADLTCPVGDDGTYDWPPTPEDTSAALNKSLHFQLFFGVGGDFHFGDQWFE